MDGKGGKSLELMQQRLLGKQQQGTNNSENETGGQADGVAPSLTRAPTQPQTQRQAVPHHSSSSVHAPASFVHQPLSQSNNLLSSPQSHVHSLSHSHSIAHVPLSNTGPPIKSKGKDFAQMAQRSNSIGSVGSNMAPVNVPESVVKQTQHQHYMNTHAPPAMGIPIGAPPGGLPVNGSHVNMNRPPLQQPQQQQRNSVELQKQAALQKQNAARKAAGLPPLPPPAVVTTPNMTVVPMSHQQSHSHIHSHPHHISTKPSPTSRQTSVGTRAPASMLPNQVFHNSVGASPSVASRVNSSIPMPIHHSHPPPSPNLKSSSTAANSNSSPSNPSRDELLAVESHKQWLADNTSSVAKATSNPISMTNAQGFTALDALKSQNTSKQAKVNAKKVNKPTPEPKSVDAKMDLGLLQGMKLSSLMRSLDVTGMYKLDESAKEQVIELANDFINALSHQSLKLSKHRIKMQELKQRLDQNDNKDKAGRTSNLSEKQDGRKVVNVFDVALVLRKNWGITIQGLEGPEICRRPNLTESRVISTALRNQASTDAFSTSEGRSGSSAKARGGKSAASGKRKKPGNSQTTTDVIAASMMTKKSRTGSVGT